MICKATIKLSLSEKECLGSSSDSESNTEKITKEKIKIFRKRRKKKKVLKKKAQPVQDYSDSELQNMHKSQNHQGLSVFDLLPAEKLRSQLLTQRSKTPQPKILSEKKNEITRQLAEVQAKLYTLKNKLWFGVGNGDVPLSWGSGRFYYTNNSRSASPQKFCKKASKKESKKQEKGDNKASKKDTKTKVGDAKEKPTKNQNGLRRQVAVEWSVSVDNLKIHKSKSLPDNSSYSLALERKTQNEVDKRDKKKKKKKPNSKFAKKAKAVTNAKSFTQKD